MSDHDSRGNAWLQSPSAYLATRPSLFAVPARPQSCYLPMRDGCRLAADIYLPQPLPGTAPPAHYPTVTIFTPYYRRFRLSSGGAEPSPNAAKYRDAFVPKGYAVVVVDVRGTGASFGTRDALRSPTERDDYYEVADWIAAQPWSNGRIGSTGISYLGAAACFLASTGHPAVRAIAPLFSVSDIYSEQLYPGGMLSKIWVQAYDELMLALDQDQRHLLANFPYFNDPRFDGPERVDEDVDGALVRAAIDEHRNNFTLADLAPEFAFRDDATLHDPALDTGSCSPYCYLDGIRPDVAVYSISGWYDGGGYANGAITRFLSLPSHDSRLLLGPWDHGARTNVSPWRDHAASDFPLLGEVLRFFDQHLLDIDTGLQREARVHYHSIHDNQWHAAQAWPPSDNRQTLWLAAGASMVPQRPEGAPALSTQVSFDWTTGRNSRYERLGAANIEDYYVDWSAHEAALPHFDTAPLAAPMTIAGHVVAQLTVAASQPDAAVFVYLSEVEASGAVRYITEGMLRASHRRTEPGPAEYRTTWPYRAHRRAEAERLTTGVPVSLTFALLPVAWTLSAGSRLRASIAGADRGHFPQVPHGRPPVLRVSIGGADGSFLEVPVLPDDEAR
ncbi:CocE/NonD family hydrolase [Cupriavidus necator]|uniref:CocE/NonD family hydrolase n=1 Tax=Cupriavidus necator TaxID=106590 RepID=UPI00339D44F8